jgi:hypothetical protein
MSKRVRLVAIVVLVAAAGAWLGAQEQPAATPTQEFWIQRAPGGKGYGAPQASSQAFGHKGQTQGPEFVERDGRQGR